MVAQVNPPFSNKGIVFIFIGTLCPPFYNWMIVNTSSNFFDIVTIGEKIEHEVKIGRIINNSIESMGSKKPVFNKKK